MPEVFVAGTGCVPVGKHPLGTGRTLARQAAQAALADVGATFRDMDALYAGVAMPSSPWAVLVAKELGLTGLRCSSCSVPPPAAWQRFTRR